MVSFNDDPYDVPKEKATLSSMSISSHSLDSISSQTERSNKSDAPSPTVKLQLSKKSVLKNLKVKLVHVRHEPADKADLDYS